MNMFQGPSLWGGLISGGITQIQDTRSLADGELDGKQYAVRTTENVTGAVGVMAGIEYGAMFGTSMLPGVGTVVGSLVGGILGHTVGRRLGHQAGDMLLNNRIIQNRTQQSEQSPIH